MIKFFRKIRQVLLAENKFRKYLLYALGEIALIMIGILLALQINNWNQKNKELAEERIILTRLNNELSSNSQQLAWLQNSFQKKEESIIKLSLIYKTKKVENDSAFISDIIRSTSFGWIVQPLSRSIYNELINTGKLGIIRNVELRNSISQLYNLYDIYLSVGLKRTSDFAKVVYGIVPMAGDTRLKSGLSSQEKREIVVKLMDLDLDHFLTFEQNRVRLIQSFYKNIENSVKELKIKIEQELG